MTTNSPNPVDGDVQSYQMPCLTEQQRQKQISFCEAVIKSSWADPLMVENCLISLAALTAEPVAYVHPAYLQPGALGFDASVGRLAPAQVELYTTPPAQILRPVELPDCVDDLHGVGPVMSADAVVEALRQQGYEVKS